MLKCLHLRGIAVVAFLLIGALYARPLQQVHTVPGYNPLPLFAGAERAQQLPGILSAQDIETAARLRASMQDAQWDEAEQLGKNLVNPELLGGLLAQKYLSPAYRTQPEEIVEWMASYADLPQASAIRSLGVRKGIPERVLPRVHATLLTGYGESNGLSVRPFRPAKVAADTWENRNDAKSQWQRISDALMRRDYDRAAELIKSPLTEDRLKANEIALLRWELAERLLYDSKTQEAYILASKAADLEPGAHWVAGISAWKLHDKAAATKHFSRMIDAEGISAWERSAAAYWSYRGHTALKDKTSASRYLEKAAEAPRTFYGALACRALGRSVITSPPSMILTAQEINALYKVPAVRRAVAYAQMEDREAAELELRHYFMQSAPQERKPLLYLAKALNLPALQMSIANRLLLQGEPVEYALYPVPAWRQENDPGADASLVLALARQESGFHASAQGKGGAFGVMQLMPDTAKWMHKELGKPVHLEMENLWEPAANMEMGGNYVRQLMDSPPIGGNLFYLIAAYNAGPGKVEMWRAQVEAGNDPLLFMELIPYALTRNYVKQVMTNYWIYQELKGEEPVSAKALVDNRWPVHTPVTRTVAVR